MGGDEFLVLLEDFTDSENVRLYADRLVSALCQPVELNGERLGVGASVGVAISPEAGADAAELTRAADTAMYSAKESGGSRVHVYDPSMVMERKSVADLPALARDRTSDSG